MNIDVVTENETLSDEEWRFPYEVDDQEWVAWAEEGGIVLFAPVAELERSHDPRAQEVARQVRVNPGPSNSRDRDDECICA